MFSQRFMVPGILLALALYWLWVSVRVYGVWSLDGPAGGFMPFVASAITIVFCLATLIKVKQAPQKWHMTIFIPVACVLGIMAVAGIIGLLPALLLMLIVWLKFLERYPWTFTLTTSLSMMTLVWLIFRLWLKVPFPKGILFA